MELTIEEIQAYLNYCESLVNTNEDMDLDTIDSNIATYEALKGKIDIKIAELQQQRTKRMKNVKMLIKRPPKQDKIAC